VGAFKWRVAGLAKMRGQESIKLAPAIAFQLQMRSNVRSENNGLVLRLSRDTLRRSESVTLCT
jgi:hypothetical protein